MTNELTRGDKLLTMVQAMTRATTTVMAIKARGDRVRPTDMMTDEEREEYRSEMRERVL